MWAGILLCLGAITGPSAFAELASADAGRLMGVVLKQEAYLSLALGVCLLLVERRRRQDGSERVGSVFSANILLLLGTLFCTVAGYFAVQPMMQAARAGQGAWSFAALHAVSGSLFVLKGLLVLALAWRLAPAVTVAATTS